MALEEREITVLLRADRSGDVTAADALFPLVYSELHRIAERQLRKERPNHTLQPTALVHDAYLRMLRGRGEWQDRTHFYSIASRVMRQVLIDYARNRGAAKRGGPQNKVCLEDQFATTPERSVDLIALDLALQRLEGFDQRQAQVVEMRFFGGMDEEEIAQVLGVSSRTVKRDWRLAKAWLFNELSPRPDVDSGSGRV